MRHVTWIVLAIVVAVLAVFLLPGHLGLPPLASEQLVVKRADGDQASQPLDQSPVLNPALEGWAELDLAESPDGRPVAGFGIYHAPLGPGVYQLRTNFWHDDEYRMKSMRIVFRIPFDMGQLALVVPSGGPWNDPHFARNLTSGEITFSVDQLGSMGIGSVSNEFIFQQFSAPDDTSTLDVQAIFTLGNSHFLQLKEKRAEPEIRFSLPVQQ